MLFREQAGFSFRHLARMTDNTGLLEHSLGMIPRRKEGYTTDDNARALWASLLWLELLDREPGTEEKKETLRRLADTYAAFLLWAQCEDGRFHNNFRYDRTPEPEIASDDCQGRALWAAAIATVQRQHPGLRLPAEELLLRGLRHAETMTFPRGWAYALAACCLLVRYDRQGDANGMSAALRQEIRSRSAVCAELLEARLLRLYETNAGPGWRWFEPTMTYGNGILPWSLLYAHETTGSMRSLETGRTALDFLIERMTAPQGWIRPVGNRGWGTKDGQAMWDQQPLDVMKLALAAGQAYRVTQRRDYLRIVAACRDWFHGWNDGGALLADQQEGSCCDGLTEAGPNVNCGAESTLAYALTEAIYFQNCKDVGTAESRNGTENESYSPCL